MEHPCSPTEACSVDEQEDVDYDMQSGSVFRYDAYSSVTESAVGYLSWCAEVLLQLSRGEVRHLVVELL